MPRKYPSEGPASTYAAGFNEAGADAPEIHPESVQSGRGSPASMRPGRMPRKYEPARLAGVMRPGDASMRPGRMPRKYLINAVNESEHDRGLQ